LALAQRLGADAGDFDAITILQSIALDCAVPASARVQACKILLELDRDGSGQPIDPVSERALALMDGAGRA
jgi:hypothetical protein